MFSMAAAGGLLIAATVAFRVIRVQRGAAEIPIVPGTREGPRHTRYWPRVISWDDRSSSRVDRVFVAAAGTTLLAAARGAADSLERRGWYLVTPDDLSLRQDPQVIVWQRDPDERLDLSQLWPVPGMSREQRLYGGRFPAAFLDEPVVIGWSWSLDGPRSARPIPPRGRAIVQPPPPPPPPAH